MLIGRSGQSFSEIWRYEPEVSKEADRQALPTGCAHVESSKGLARRADKTIVRTLLQRLETGLSLASRRTEPRYDADGFVQVFDEGRTGCMLGRASIRNISASGICISMPQRLASGRRVYLAGDGLNVDCIVRHAAAGCDGYIMGLEFIREPALSADDFSGLPAAW